jgi:hypothetical protein
MICFNCKTNFCYLCGTYIIIPEIPSNVRFLDPKAPYTHFWAGDIKNRTGCEGMLFAGIEENGDWVADQRGPENDNLDLDFHVHEEEAEF